MVRYECGQRPRHYTGYLLYMLCCTGYTVQAMLYMLCCTGYLLNRLCCTDYTVQATCLLVGAPARTASTAGRRQSRVLDYTIRDDAPLEEARQAPFPS